MTYTVPRDMYAAALGEELPADMEEEFSVDRRGYAEAVGEALGADYLNNTILVFDDEQANAPLHRAEYSFLPDLVDRVYDKSEMTAYASPSNPLKLDVMLERDMDKFVSHAYVTDNETRNRIEHALGLREQVHKLGVNGIRDRERVEELVDGAQEAIDAFGDLATLQLNREAASTRFTHFSYESSECMGYVFPALKPDDPVNIVVTEETATPWNGLETVTYNIHEGTGRALKSLYYLDELQVRDDDIDDSIRRIGQAYFAEQGEEELSKPQFYRALRNQWDDLPVVCHALHDLKDGDFTVETFDETAKLDFLTPDSDEASEVLQAVRELVARGTFPDADRENRKSRTRRDPGTLFGSLKDMTRKDIPDLYPEIKRYDEERYDTGFNNEYKDFLSDSSSNYDRIDIKNYFDEKRHRNDEEYL